MKQQFSKVLWFLGSWPPFPVFFLSMIFRFCLGRMLKKKKKNILRSMGVLGFGICCDLEGRLGSPPHLSGRRKPNQQNRKKKQANQKKVPKSKPLTSCKINTTAMKQTNLSSLFIIFHLNICSITKKKLITAIIKKFNHPPLSSNPPPQKKTTNLLFLQTKTPPTQGLQTAPGRLPCPSAWSRRLLVL